MNANAASKTDMWTLWCCLRWQGAALLPWVSHHTHHVRALASLALKDLQRVGGATHVKPEERRLLEASLLFMEQNEEVAKLHDHLHTMCTLPRAGTLAARIAAMPQTLTQKTCWGCRAGSSRIWTSTA